MDAYGLWCLVAGFLHLTFVLEFHLYWSLCQYFVYFD